MYFSHGRTQKEIAEHLKVSRTTVIKLLEEARRKREIKFWIEEAEEHCVGLGVDVSLRLEIEEVIVVPAGKTADETTSSVGLALGKYLSNAVQNSMTVGVGWGRTLTASLDSFRPMPRKGVKVLSLLGGTVDPVKTNPVEFSWRFANALGAECYLFPAPLLVNSAETKNNLIENCGLETLFQQASKLDMAVLSVGDVGKKCTSLSQTLIPKKEFQELIQAGCVADMMCNFIDKEGRDVAHPISDRVMSIGLHDVKSCPHIVLASGGEHRAQAILAAIKRTGCHTLVTDEGAAAALLDLV